MNESITRAAGAVHGQEMPPESMEALIRSLGREPRQRTTCSIATSTRKTNCGILMEGYRLAGMPE